MTVALPTIHLENMGKYIDETLWRRALCKPDWYLILADDFKRLEKLAEQQKNNPDHKVIKGEAYSLVEEALRIGTIPRAPSGENLDKQRKPIDTIVIHHTKNRPGMTLGRLNAMQLLRIYGMYYANPTDKLELQFKGQAVWSGHFYNGEQVFWGYHWLVRENGELEHILDDKYIGWHAGNWDINTRSVAICIDDDLSNREPNNVVIGSIAKLLRDQYLTVNPRNIVGHCDVNKKTECPGRLFHESWRQKLLNKIV